MGKVVNIDHFEPVGYWHMAHSFVRGNWRNEQQSTFMLLAKCCHDTDMLRWLINKPCKKVSSFGSLMHFKPENAPEGSTLRCTDGCKVEASCPYSALKVYMDMKKQGWPVTVITSDLSEAGRMKALKEGPYGKCVYHTDNNVVDHQVVNLEFEGGVTATLTMSGFSPQQGMGMRQTRVMGTHGYLEGNMKSFTYTDFRTNEQTLIDTGIKGGDAGSGHGGGDWALVEQFCKAVSENNPAYLTSTVAVSVESHKIAFKAEKSRLTGKVQTI
jgi:predicted dehydrogenase